MIEMIYKIIGFITIKMKHISIHNFFTELLMIADSKKRVVPSQIICIRELQSLHAVKVNMV